MTSDIQQTLDERGSRYGEFDEHARITQEIKAVLVTGRSWENCSASQRESLEMIAHKLGRIVNGDPDYDDSWRDIAGYAQLIVNELADKKPAPPKTAIEDNLKALRVWSDVPFKSAVYLDDFGRVQEVKFQDAPYLTVRSYFGSADDYSGIKSVSFVCGANWANDYPADGGFINKGELNNAISQNVSHREPSINNDRIACGARNPDASVSATRNPSDADAKLTADGNIHRRQFDKVIPRSQTFQHDKD